MKRAFWYMLIPVFATSVYCYCLFAIMSFMGQGSVASYDFFVVFVCAVISVIINYRFLMRERTVVSVAVLNALMIVLTIFLGFSAPNDVEGFWLHVIAGLCFAIPVLHGFFLCREPMKTDTMLLFCEFSIVGTLVMVTMQLGEMSVSPLANVLSIAALVLNLFMLSVLRITGPAKKSGAGGKGIQRGTLLITGFVGLIFMSVCIVLFALPASRNAIFSVVYATRDFFIWIGKQIEAFVVFLASLFPADAMDELEPMEMITADSADAEMDALTNINPAIGFWIFIVFVVFALVAGVILLVRFRRKKMCGRVAVKIVYSEDDEGRSFSRGLSALLTRLKEAIRFRQFCIRRYGSYEEAFLRIERRAKRCGIRRNASETSGEFLRRVVLSLADGVGLEDRFIDFSTVVSAAVDRRLYSGKDAAFTLLPPREAETLASFLAAIGKRRPKTGRKESGRHE